MGEKIQCPECGSENTSDSQFCQECGSKLADDIENRSKSKISRNRGLMILAIIILAFILIFGSYYAYHAATTKTYTGDGFTFQYPNDYNETFDRTYDPYANVLLVNKPEKTYLSIYIMDNSSLANNLGVDDLASLQRMMLEEGDHISINDPIQIAGVTGNQFIAFNPITDVNKFNIMFVKNGKVYDFYMITNDNNKQTELYDIVDSFQTT